MQVARGRVSEALVAVNEAIKLAPRDVELLLARAALNERAGRAADAAFDYLAVSQIAPPGSADRLKGEEGVARLREK